jgi:hypothetical protein
VRRSGCRCAGRGLRKRRWKWGSSHPSGTISEIVEEGKASVTSNKVRRPAGRTSAARAGAERRAGEHGQPQRARGGRSRDQDLS